MAKKVLPIKLTTITGRTVFVFPEDMDAGGQPNGVFTPHDIRRTIRHMPLSQFITAHVEANVGSTTTEIMKASIESMDPVVDIQNP